MHIITKKNMYFVSLASDFRFGKWKLTWDSYRNKYRTIYRMPFIQLDIFER